jgi:hypothetical protein
METMGETSGHAASALRQRLRHIYWIGGGSGAGKSTIARRMAARHGLRPNASTRKRKAWDYASSRSTPRCPRTTWPNE